MRDGRQGRVGEALAQGAQRGMAGQELGEVLDHGARPLAQAHVLAGHDQVDQGLGRAHALLHDAARRRRPVRGRHDPARRFFLARERAGHVPVHRGRGVEPTFRALVRGQERQRRPAGGIDLQHPAIALQGHVGAIELLRLQRGQAQQQRLLPLRVARGHGQLAAQHHGHLLVIALIAHQRLQRVERGQMILGQLERDLEAALGLLALALAPPQIAGPRPRVGALARIRVGVGDQLARQGLERARGQLGRADVLERAGQRAMALQALQQGRAWRQRRGLEGADRVAVLALGLARAAEPVRPDVERHPGIRVGPDLGRGPRQRHQRLVDVDHHRPRAPAPRGLAEDQAQLAHCRRVRRHVPGQHVERVLGRLHGRLRIAGVEPGLGRLDLGLGALLGRDDQGRALGQGLGAAERVAAGAERLRAQHQGQGALHLAGLAGQHLVEIGQRGAQLDLARARIAGRERVRTVVAAAGHRARASGRARVRLAAQLHAREQQVDALAARGAVIEQGVDPAPLGAEIAARPPGLEERARQGARAHGVDLARQGMGAVVVAARLVAAADLLEQPCALVGQVRRAGEIARAVQLALVGRPHRRRRRFISRLLGPGVRGMGREVRLCRARQGRDRSAEIGDRAVGIVLRAVHVGQQGMGLGRDPVAAVIRGLAQRARRGFGLARGQEAPAQAQAMARLVAGRVAAERVELAPQRDRDLV